MSVPKTGGEALLECAELVSSACHWVDLKVQADRALAEVVRRSRAIASDNALTDEESVRVALGGALEALPGGRLARVPA